MVTIEQIDEFRKRTHSSYEDAKYYLEKNNGDVLDAIIDFERMKAGKSQCCHHKKQKDDFGRSFAEILQKGFDTRIYVDDRNNSLFNVPVIILILFMPMWPVVVLFFLFLMVLGYKFSIRDVKSQNINIDSFFRNINEKMKDTSSSRQKPHGQPYGQRSGSSATTNATTNNKFQAPVVSDITPPATVETNKSDNEKNKDEGYKEYTIE